MKKGANLSDSVAIILGKAKPAPKGEATESAGDPGLSKLGKALRVALESKDDTAIGQAFADAYEYCMPEPAADEADEE